VSILAKTVSLLLKRAQVSSKFAFI